MKLRGVALPIDELDPRVLALGKDQESPLRRRERQVAGAVQNPPLVEELAEGGLVEASR